jgi:OOP family OmpA-OmpF porin
MKIKNKMVVVAISLALSAVTAHAQNWYVSASAGQSKYKASDRLDELDGGTLRNTDTAWKLQLGYQFTPHFAVEGGYFNLGKTAYSNEGYNILKDTVEADGWNMDAVGALPLGNDFSLFGKVGAASSLAKWNCTFNEQNSTGESASARKTSLHYGVGVNWNITKAWALRAEYEVFDKVGGGDIGTTKVDVWSAGVAFKF